MSYKRDTPVMIGTIIIVVLLVNYIIEVPALQTLESELLSWATIIASFALGMALVNILMVTVKRMNASKTFTSKLPKLVLLVVVLGLTIIGLAFTSGSPLYAFWFDTLHFPLHMTLNALKIFMLASAGYRAMRIRSVESGILVVSMLLVGLAATPIGEMLLPVGPQISSWLLDFPSAGANRALALTTGIGIVIFGARVLLWKENRVYGAGGE